MWRAAPFATMLAMVQLLHVDPDEFLVDTFRLGKKIYLSGFRPKHAISLWRGGTPVGLGVDELSVAPNAVPLTKDIVRSVTLAQTKDLAEQALSCNSAVDVLSMCRQLIREVAPEILELV